VLRRDLGAVPAFEVLARTGGAGAADAAGKALLAVAGVAPAGGADLDAVRVAQGVARAGAEVDERVMPNEAGLEDAVSWTKGCYLGQEPVVMARHRGRPPTLLVRLAPEGSDAGEVPAAGTALLEGERRVGRVTTSARGVGALAYVRHDLAREGRTLGVEGAPARMRVAAVLAR
jgi:folate-binding protein YgfZ